MALWGDKDNISVGTGATAYISSYTKDETYGGYPIVGSGSVWGSGICSGGDVIRFGNAVTLLLVLVEPIMVAIIVNIQSTTSCYIASTEGIKSGWVLQQVLLLSYVSQSPTFAVQDSRWSVLNDANTYTAGVSTGGAAKHRYSVRNGVGWVGVQTYVDAGSNLRVKKVLVSMSGIATGNAPIWDSNPMA